MASSFGAVGAAQVLVASNRGPVSYTVADDGSLRSKRGGGGLVSGLSAIGPESGALWVLRPLIARYGSTTGPKAIAADVEAALADAAA